MALLSFHRVRLLVGACIKAERFVLMIRFGQLLLPTFELIQVLALPFRTNQEGRRSQHAISHGHT